MEGKIIPAKINQIKELLERLERLLAYPLAEFLKNPNGIAAAERYFQLVIDIASDINTELLVARNDGIADTYKQSFDRLARHNILSQELAGLLAKGAQIRNILVHEYDFEEDYEKFYTSAKELLPAFREYAKAIYSYIREGQPE